MPRQFTNTRDGYLYRAVVVCRYRWEDPERKPHTELFGPYITKGAATTQLGRMKSSREIVEARVERTKIDWEVVE